MFHNVWNNLDSISSAMIMSSIRADMASKRLDELLYACQQGLPTLNECRDVCDLPKVDVELTEPEELEVINGLVPLTCKMCGGTLDHGLTCMFCGTHYKWR